MLKILGDLCPSLVSLTTLVLAVRVETEKGKGSLEVALKTAEVCFDHLLENTTIIH